MEQLIGQRQEFMIMWKHAGSSVKSEQESKLHLQNELHDVKIDLVTQEHCTEVAQARNKRPVEGIC